MLADLEEYGEMTQSSLLYLTLETLDVRSVEADHVASHIGKALAIATLLRGTPFHCSAHQRYLPSEVLTRVSSCAAARAWAGDCKF